MKNVKELPNFEAGFSLPELLIVVLIISIMGMISLLNPFLARKYSSDRQSLLILDILQEARQKALTQRETMRVEINNTKKQISLIDENKSDTTEDDIYLKTFSFSDAVVVGTHPDNLPLANVPKATYSIPEIVYSQSIYPLSYNEQTFTLRFTKTGEVVDQGINSTGSGAVMTGATIYVYETTNNGTAPSVIRALTVSGISGMTSFFKCRLDANGLCSEWVK